MPAAKQPRDDERRRQQVAQVWVPRCAKIVCHVSIAVNVSLLMLPYQQLFLWAPESCSEIKELHTQDHSVFNSCQPQFVVMAFVMAWLPEPQKLPSAPNQGEGFVLFGRGGAVRGLELLGRVSRVNFWTSKVLLRGPSHGSPIRGA